MIGGGGCDLRLMNQNGTIDISGDRIAITSASLEWLITWAHDIHTSRLYSKPNWLNSVRYDILANAPGYDAEDDRRPGRLQRMMQALLRDRFKLVLHTETRELPMYAMVVAPSGLKIHLTELRGEIGQSPFGRPGRGRLVGAQVTSEMLANVLSNQLGRTVQDQTGLSGVFDFKLEWEPDGQATDSTNARMGPSLFTAIQEQLGLKLEARKGSVEVLVIDRIERTPTEN